MSALYSECRLQFGGIVLRLPIAASVFSANQGVKATLSLLKRPGEKTYTQRCRLFVGNLPTDISDDEFKKLFSKYGEAGEVFINKSKGFGFIKLIGLHRKYKNLTDHLVKEETNLMRRQEELRRMEEMHNQEMQKRKEMQLRQEEERRRREEELILRQREMEEQMRRQREEGYRMSYMDPRERDMRMGTNSLSMGDPYAAAAAPKYPTIGSTGMGYEGSPGVTQAAIASSLMANDMVMYLTDTSKMVSLTV
ncbi:hypothetical protein AB205_0079650 [Aquarana catesbeiana]|uniref:RRM domain-containing protein n=1 Tax=Aquarana catesbeiana TaxID=8400 RepID=A0A2G9R559_AQUCT|nr:hypothetical protein AB205_0079650 [Aquarana catesbeiana]